MRADLAAVLRLHTDPRAVQHNPSERLDGGLPAASALFDRWDAHWRRHGFGYWTVVPAKDPGDTRPANGSGGGPGNGSGGLGNGAGGGGSGGRSGGDRAAAVIGFCGLKVLSFRDREVLNLFYRFDPAHWGRGYATEAAGAVVGWAGERLPDWPVMARVRVENGASQRVAERIGLTRSPDLDEPGEDGPERMYTRNWHANTRP